MDWCHAQLQLPLWLALLLTVSWASRGNDGPYLYSIDDKLMQFTYTPAWLRNCRVLLGYIATNPKINLWQCIRVVS